MKIVIYFLVVFAPLFCNAQKQGNIWYFGDHAGLNFNSGSPVVLTNGQIGLYPNPSPHSEGTSVISDSSGNLLFYTDGSTIWNKNHSIMSNGDNLLGHPSSTQSALIIPQPQSKRNFYVFTTDAFTNGLTNGLRYSIVDMCINNGLGHVIDEKKNILLLDTVSEKLTATKHTNGVDYWIVTHKYFSDAFYAYLLTANGIEDTIISHVGSIHQNVWLPSNTNAAIGQMKISPNGTKIALCFSNTNPAKTELFSFNNTTGVVSNLISLTSSGNEYGLSFSPNSSKLYFSTGGNGTIYQYNLLQGNGNPDSILASKQNIAQIGNGLCCIVDALQLGPDGKIYIAREGKTFLGVINSPNLQGNACNFQDNAISLGGKACSLGLPNFIDSYDYSNTVIDCETGINEADNNQLIMRVYPNPSNAVLTISLPKQQFFKLHIVDITGRIVYTNKNATGNITVDASGFSSGVYFVKAVNQRTVLTGKLVKE
jgi:hypothetical protein